MLYGSLEQRNTSVTICVGQISVYTPVSTGTPLVLKIFAGTLIFHDAYNCPIDTDSDRSISLFKTMLQYLASCCINYRTIINFALFNTMLTHCNIAYCSAILL